MSQIVNSFVLVEKGLLAQSCCRVSEVFDKLGDPETCHCVIPDPNSARSGSYFGQGTNRTTRIQNVIRSLEMFSPIC